MDPQIQLETKDKTKEKNRTKNGLEIRQTDRQTDRPRTFRFSSEIEDRNIGSTVDNIT
ncbi:hypothetical protein PILCRDRAFT_812070 [Piloderma croceum F 1598]|uniref:Uncharacterized protein n=1 Tax=Piloderma croceum (strain F 1598) TaxID=765440 RepID=A0A0C3G1X4_PILCF|nr:hypothetical protein PILCRDRAFT_812070 [Piloderma croceum F 1598]